MAQKSSPKDEQKTHCGIDKDTNRKKDNNKKQNNQTDIKKNTEGNSRQFGVKEILGTMTHAEVQENEM